MTFSIYGKDKNTGLSKELLENYGKMSVSYP